MIVTSDNSIIGTIGGGCAEAEVITKCRDIFNGFFEEEKIETIKVRMSTDNAEKEGMVCGGNINVMLEKIQEKNFNV